MTLIDQSRLLAALETEAQLMASSARGADTELAVPWCPGLTLGETVRHTGSVYRMVLSWLRSGDRPKTWQRGPDDGQSTEDFLLGAMRALSDELARHEPDEPCPTWWSAQSNYGFWRRRMAHESTVHRVDVQQALGLRVAVDTELAVDGVDEVLTLWFGHRLNVKGVFGSRTDRVLIGTGGRHWLLTTSTTGTSAELADPADVEVPATVTGNPTEVYLWLWGRRAHTSHTVTVEGDHDAVANVWALLRLATR